MSSTHVYIRETAVGFPTTEYLVRVNNAERDALTAFINHWRETRHHALLEGRGLWHWFDVVTGTTVSDARIAYTATNTPLPAETPDFFTTTHPLFFGDLESFFEYIEWVNKTRATGA